MTTRQRTPRILVVDDDLGVIASYRHVLEGAYGADAREHERQFTSLEQELFAENPAPNGIDRNWRVTFADQGDDAVMVARAAARENDPFDLIFLDSRMPPGMDGYETAKEIRKISGDTQIVIVSAFSDYLEDEFVEAAGPEGRICFLPKPVWPDELLAATIELTRG